MHQNTSKHNIRMRLNASQQVWTDSQGWKKNHKLRTCCENWRTFSQRPSSLLGIVLCHLEQSEVHQCGEVARPDLPCVAFCGEAVLALVLQIRRESNCASRWCGFVSGYGTASALLRLWRQQQWQSWPSWFDCHNARYSRCNGLAAAATDLPCLYLYIFVEAMLCICMINSFWFNITLMILRTCTSSKWIRTWSNAWAEGSENSQKLPKSWKESESFENSWKQLFCVAAWSM